MCQLQITILKRGQQETVSRIVTNEKYIGKWTWNKTGTRRDPRTGRQKKFTKPESEWIIKFDESLRIVPQDIWDEVQTQRAERKRSWPGGKGKRGFQSKNGSVEKHFPKESVLRRYDLQKMRICNRKS